MMVMLWIMMVGNHDAGSSHANDHVDNDCMAACNGPLLLEMGYVTKPKKFWGS